MLQPEQAFGTVLKHYRGLMGVSQEELAHLCGLDRTYISMLERGLRKPTLNTIFALAGSLSVRPSTLVQEVEKLVKQ